MFVSGARPRTNAVRPQSMPPRQLAVFLFLVGTSAARSELITMTYQSDARRDKRDDKFYISWIIRGGIVIAIIIAALAFTSTNYPDRDVPQITTTVPAPAS